MKKLVQRAKNLPNMAKKARTTLKMWGRLLGLIWHTRPMFIVWLLVITGLSGLVPVLQIQVTTQIIQDAVLAVQGGREGQLVHQALVFGGLQGGLAIASALLELAQQQIQSLFMTLLANRIARLIMVKANTLGIEHFENNEFQNKLRRAQEEGTHRPYQIFWSLVGIGNQLMRLLSVLLLLFSWNGLLGWLILFAPLPALAARLFYGQKQYDMERERTEKYRFQWFLKGLSTDRDNVKEMRVFRLSEHILQRYQEITDEFYRAERDLNQREARFQAPFTVLTNAVSAGAQIFAISLTIGLKQIGRLAGYMQAIVIVQGAVEGLSWSISQLYSNSLFVGNLFEFLDFAPQPIQQGDRRVPERLERGIEFRHVSFHYPGTQERVLEDVNLFLKAGECVAIVGKNGAGKTTLVKLLTRLYEPTSGTILLDGVPLSEYDLQDLHRHMSVIFQDFVKYPMTVRENVGFGYIEKMEEEPLIRTAIAKSGAESMVEEDLPEKYDTVLGRMFEKGKELSGGQWQKIALARAFMRNAPVVVLDEPTASIDAEAEADIFSRLREIATGATTLLIAHRFSTVRIADRILVLKHGQIIEDGTHQELLALDGTYAHLFRLQAAGYVEG